MKTNAQELFSALAGAFICAFPFVEIWWHYGRSGNPHNTDSWAMGIPAITLTPVAALFGAIAGLWIRAGIKKLRASFKDRFRD